MVYAEFGEQTECIMGNWKIENCTMADSDLQIIKGAGGCSTHNGLYREVPWLPLENNFFCSGFRYEWVGISRVEVY